MRLLARSLGFLALLATVTVACSDSNDPADGDDDDNSGSRGTVQGSFGHSGALGIITFVATTVLPFENSQGVGVLAVDASGRRFEFFVPSKSTGSHSVNVTSTLVSVEIGTQLWGNPGNTATGTITINSITATTMSGTVSLVLQAVPGTGTTGNMTVALTFNGTFGQT
jgi:hypothetical protein